MTTSQSTETRVVNGLVIDDSTHRGHLHFKSFFNLRCGDGQERKLDEWIEWQLTRDPALDDPDFFKELSDSNLEKIRAERRGPGIAKRPRPAKKTAPKQ